MRIGDGGDFNIDDVGVDDDADNNNDAGDGDFNYDDNDADGGNVVEAADDDNKMQK